MSELQIQKDESLFSETKFAHAMKVAEFMSKSDLIPKSMKGKPADILVAMESGRRLGLGEMQSLQNIAVINGKPTLYGDGLLAACQGHSAFQSISEEPIKGDKGETTGFTCTIIRRGYDAPVVRSFTVEQARKAGLWGGGVWAKYPERMLQMRARGFALRDAFSDALNGFVIEEEANDIPAKQTKTDRAKDLLADLIPPKNEPKEKVIEAERQATIEQQECITKLMTDKNVAEERAIRAFSQFDKSELHELSFDQACILIKQLESI